MEKIKQALAKVKSQNKAGLNTGTKAKNESIEKTNAPFNKDIGQLKYTKSKVKPVDHAHLENNRIVSHLSNNPIAGVFNSLRTQVLQKMDERKWQSIAIVSPNPDSGKTLVGVNLAISIAHQPQKTALLVDFDLRRPTVAQYMGIDNQKSINDFLSGEATVDEVMTNPGIQRLVVVPTMKSVERSAEILSSEKVKDLMKELKTRYSSRVILYDLPPLLISDDALVVIPEVDCVLMVIGNGVSTSKEINDAIASIPEDKLIGVVYNKADEEAQTYY